MTCQSLIIIDFVVRTVFPKLVEGVSHVSSSTILIILYLLSVLLWEELITVHTSRLLLIAKQIRCYYYTIVWVLLNIYMY